MESHERAMSGVGYHRNCPSVYLYTFFPGSSSHMTWSPSFNGTLRKWREMNRAVRVLTVSRRMTTGVYGLRSAFAKLFKVAFVRRTAMVWSAV